MVGSAIGQDKSGRFVKRHAGRCSEYLGGLGHHLFSHATVAEHRDDTVTKLEVGHARAELIDFTGHLATGSERACRTKLVFVFDDQGIGIIHAAGAHPDAHFAGAGGGRWQFTQDQGGRAAWCGAEHGFHSGSPFVRANHGWPRQTRRRRGFMPCIGLWCALLDAAATPPRMMSDNWKFAQADIRVGS